MAIKGLKEGLAGGDPWKMLDGVWIKVQHVVSKLLELDNAYFVPVAGGIGALLTLLGGGFMVVFTALVYLAAEYIAIAINKWTKLLLMDGNMQMA